MGALVQSLDVVQMEKITLLDKNLRVAQLRQEKRATLRKIKVIFYKKKNGNKFVKIQNNCRNL